MQAHHESDERSGGPGVEVTRGVIVILLAVAVGAFVVTQGLKSDSESVAAASDVAAVSGAEEGSLGSDAGDENAQDGTADGNTADGNTADDNTADDNTADDNTADDNTADGSAGEESTADGISGATAESGDGDDGDAAATGDDEDTTASTAAPADAESDPAGPGAQAAGDIKVLVLNGAGAKGTAGRGSAILQEAGYEVLAPRNANFLGPSKIFYTEGFEEAANGVAGAYSVDPGAVVAPLDPANPPINDTRGADVIVVVGEDGLIQV